MMDSSSSSKPCVPPGFRFHPTDEELVGYYLRKKVASQRIDLDVIRDIDLYRIEPWDLQDKCRIGYEEQNEWYFFSHKDKKYPTGTRTNRATMAGFWKATGRDKAVYDKHHKLTGMRKTLVFYKGRAPNGQKTDWIMHEYRLESEENAPPQEEGWVVCRAFKKKNTVQTKTNTMEGWNTPYFSYDELINNTNTSDITSSLISVLDPSTGVDLLLDYNNNSTTTMQPPNFLPPLSSMCNQETEEKSLKFLQLPELESPSFPIIKKNNISISISSENNNNNNNNSSKKVTTDWRDIDKFVASQLMSHEKGETTSVENNNNQCVIGCDSEDMGLLLLQSSKEEADKLNGLLGSSSTSDFDIGICIFDGK